MSARRGNTRRSGTAKSTKSNKSKDAAASNLAQEMKSYSTDEMKQMRMALRITKMDVLNEKKLLNDLQQQKERIEQFWMTEKKKRDDLKMDLRNVLRQKQDLDEKHSFELKVYKQKFQHLLHEQQANMTDVRIDAKVALQMQHAESREKQHQDRLNNRQTKVLLKGAELAHIDLVKSIKQNQERNIMLLRQEYQRKSEELKQGYEKKMRVVREAFDSKRKHDITQIEMRKTGHIAKLMFKHKQAFDDIKNYYRDITHNNLDLIRTLKEEVSEMKKKEQGMEKEVRDISRINKKLTLPLQKNKDLVEKLQEDLRVHKEEKACLANVKSKLVVLEEKMKNLDWEHEILSQKHEHLSEEKNELQDKLEGTIYVVQQKTGFKNLILERKLTAMSHDLEKTEAALDEVLASTNLQPEVIGDIQHNLEDVLMSKNKLVQTLEDDLQEIKEKYAATILLYESKMAEYEIPREELGFNPVRRF